MSVTFGSVSDAADEYGATFDVGVSKCGHRFGVFDMIRALDALDLPTERPNLMIMGVQQYRYMRFAIAYPVLMRAYRHLSRTGDGRIQRYAHQRIVDLKRVMH